MRSHRSRVLRHLAARVLVGLALGGTLATEAHADPASTYQWMLTNGVIASAQSQNGVATAVIGPHFYDTDAPSLQALSVTLLTYLQSQDAAAQSFTVVDTLGNPVGQFANGALTLNQP